LTARNVVESLNVELKQSLAFGAILAYDGDWTEPGFASYSG
jgi:hypothetical protein